MNAPTTYQFPGPKVEPLPEPKINLPSRETGIAAFRARVAVGAQKPVPGHVLSECDRLVFEGRAPGHDRVTEGTLIYGRGMVSRQVRDLEQFLAVICLMRTAEWDRDAGKKLREATRQLRDALDLIDDQTHAAEDVSEGLRSVAPRPPY